MNNDKNIRSTTGNKDALDLLENIRKKVEEGDGTVEMLALLRIDGEYVRYSTGIEDLLELIGYLEVAKYDSLKRMSD